MSFELKMEKFYTFSKDKMGNGLAQSKFYAPKVLAHNKLNVSSCAHSEAQSGISEDVTISLNGVKQQGNLLFHQLEVPGHS